MSATATPLAFWDVDTQVDFMRPNGRLYVPGAESLAGSLAALTRAGAEHRVPLVATADDHEPGDAELSDDPDFSTTYPPHCMRGTPGAERIPETRREWTLEVGHQRVPEATLARALEVPGPAILIHKKRFDAFSNVNTEPLLRRLAPREVVVYGVALDVCSRAAVEGLLARGVLRVTVVTDATRAIDRTAGEALLADWAERGVALVPSGEVLRRLAAPGR